VYEFEATELLMRAEFPWFSDTIVNCSSAGPQCPSSPRDYLVNATDVFTYFTGLTSVPDLAENNWLPGAVGDHLTSYGGILTNTSGQMPIVEFLAAGATGSYGTVVEPCAFTEKFPDPSVFLPHYLKGDTLVEAYWKSVSWPGEGLFVGEPLACPYRASEALGAAPPVVDVDKRGRTVVVTVLLAGGQYDIFACSGARELEGECGAHPLIGVTVTNQASLTPTRIELPYGQASGFAFRHRAAPPQRRPNARSGPVAPLS